MREIDSLQPPLKAHQESLMTFFKRLALLRWMASEKIGAIYYSEDSLKTPQSHLVTDIPIYFNANEVEHWQAN